MSGNPPPGSSNASTGASLDPKTSLKPLEGWKLAREEFLASLKSDKERDEFINLNPNHLERTIKQEIENSHLAKRMNIFEKMKVNKIVEFMQTHQTAMDVFSNVKPEILCFVWGSIRVVMKLVENDKRYLEQVLGWSELLKSKMPQLEAYESLYDDKPRVMKHLVDTYTLLFEFYRTIIISLRPLKSKQRAMRGIGRAFGSLKVFTTQLYSDKNSSEFETLLSRLEKAEKAMRFAQKIEEIIDTRKRDQHLAERVEAVNTMAVGIEETTKETENVAKRTEKQVKGIRGLLQNNQLSIYKAVEKNHNQDLIRDLKRDKETLLRNLSDYSPEERHHSESNRRVDGTGEWLLIDESFLGWFSESNTNGLFLLGGSAGTGKSNITANAVDYIKGRKTKGDNLSLAYYYCGDEGDDGVAGSSHILKSSVTGILRALFKQILGPAESLLESAKRRLSFWFESDGIHISNELMVNAILDHVEETKKDSLFLVIDGIDELGNHRLNALILSIYSLLLKRDTSCNVKVFMSTRYPHEVHQLLTSGSEHQSNFRLFEQVMDKTNTSRDVKLVVEQRVSDALNPVDNMKNPWIYGPLEITDDELKDEIIAALKERAEEMILLIDPQLAELCNLGSTDPEMIRKALKTLPRDIKETYQKIYSRIQQKTKVQRGKIQRLIAWVMYAQRPIELTGINEAIAVNEDPKNQNSGHIEPLEVALTWVCGYLRVDRTKSGHIIVKIAHQTVREFFKEGEDIILTSDGGSTTGLVYSSEEGNKMIAKVCMCYINFDCFDRRKAQANIKSRVSEPNEKILQNSIREATTSGLPGIAGKAIVKIQGGLKAVGKNQSLAFRAFARSAETGSEVAFKDYAGKFWIKHAESLQLESPSAKSSKAENKQWWVLFRDIAISKEREFVGIYPRVWDNKDKQQENQWISLRKSSPPHGRLYQWAVDTGSALLLKLLIEENALKLNIQRQALLRYDSPILYLIDNNQLEPAIVLATEISTWSKKEQQKISNDLGKSLLFAFINAQFRMLQENKYGVWDYAQTTRLVRALLDAGAQVDFSDAESFRRKDEFDSYGGVRQAQLDAKTRAATAKVIEGHLPAVYRMRSTKLQEDEKGNRIEHDIFGQVTDQRSMNNTPLHLAVAFGAVESVKLLLGRGARLDAKNSNNETPFDFAVHDVVQPHSRIFPVQFPINQAKSEILLLLLERHGASSVQGGDVVTKPHGKKNDTKLHLALQNLKHPIITEDMIEKLLEQAGSARVNEGNGEGMTPLFLMVQQSLWDKDLATKNAGSAKFSNVLNVLGKNGADPNIRSSDGSAIHVCKILPPQVLVELACLKVKGLDLRSSSNDGRTPLMTLVVNGNYTLHTRKYRQVFDYWAKEVKVDIRARTLTGCTAMMEAATYLQLPRSSKYKSARWTVKQLLKLGGLDNNERNSVHRPNVLSTGQEFTPSSSTPLSLIMAGGHDHLVDLFLSGKGLIISYWDLFVAIQIAFNPWLVRTRWGFAAVPLDDLGDSYLTKILEYDNNLEKEDLDGDTVLGFFARAGDSTAVGFLIRNNANIEHRDRKNRTPLVQASRGDRTDVVTLLLENGAKCDLVAFDLELFYAIQSITDASVLQKIIRKFKEPTSDFSVFEEQLSALKFEHIQTTGYDILLKNLSTPGLVKLYCLVVSKLYEGMSLEVFMSFLRSLWTLRPEVFDNLGWNKLHKTLFAIVEPEYPCNPPYEPVRGKDPVGNASREFLDDCMVKDVAGLTSLHLAVLFGQEDHIFDFINQRLEPLDGPEATLRIVDNCGYTPLHLALLFKGNLMRSFIGLAIGVLPDLGASCHGVGDRNPTDHEFAASLVRMDLKGGSYWLQMMLGRKKVCIGPDDLDAIMFYGNCRGGASSSTMLPSKINVLEEWIGGRLDAERPLGTLLHYICAVKGTDVDDKLYEQNCLLQKLNFLSYCEDAGPPSVPFSWNIPNQEGKFPIDLLAEFAGSNYALRVLYTFEEHITESLREDQWQGRRPVFNQDDMTVYRYRPVRHAARRGLLSVVEKLLKFGFHTGRDTTETHEKTALHLAILNRQYEIVAFLLQHDGKDGLYYPELLEDLRKDTALRPELLIVESILREREVLEDDFEIPLYSSDQEGEDKLDESDWEPLSDGEFDDGDPSCPYPKESEKPEEPLVREDNKLSMEEKECSVVVMVDSDAVEGETNPRPQGLGE